MSVQLTPDVFRMLLAVGWIDGHLDEEESDAILRAARAEGFEETTLQELQALAKSPVDFGEVDRANLDAVAQLYIYGVASWVARSDDVLSEEEWAALHAIATIVGVTGRGRQAVDAIVEELAEDSDKPMRLDLTGLKEAISDKIAEVAKTH